MHTVTHLTTKTKPYYKKQIKTIIFADNTHIKYLPPNISYKMLGIYINPMLDFREHFTHITKDVKRRAKTLAKSKLSLSLKTLSVEHLLNYKYHATHIEVINERQLTTIVGISAKP